MNANTHRPGGRDPGIEGVPHAAAEHFRLSLFGVIARIIEQCAGGDPEPAVRAHPFLADYLGEMAALGGGSAASAAGWRAAVARWERAAAERLPMRSLVDAGVTALELELILATGLLEEDPRFGEVFAAAQGSERRPSFGLLLAWWRGDDEGGDDRADGVRRALLRLLDAGLLAVLNADAPRAEWVLAVPHPLWDALRGDPPALRWLAYTPRERLPRLAGYVAPAETAADCAALPAILGADPSAIVVVRGPAHNGRGTLLGCVAADLGRALLVADERVFEEEPRWRLFGALATLLGALPVVRADLAAGETRILPPLPSADAPLGVVTNRHGAWASADGRPLLVVELPLPDPPQRLLHWRSAAPGEPAATHELLAGAARLTSGSIRRVADAAAGYAALAGREGIATDDLQQACRSLQAARLETIAARLPGAGTLADLVVDGATRDELDALEARCRFRERLAAGTPALAQGNVGVRALFSGGSGTGKTLAARRLAASLGRDLYRVDLAATVNKYIGETEKNLDRAFAAAEELDVVLLLDEGDALMTRRTDVGSSNDRYANLETNFLLQRIESFGGILLVTTNAVDRIDAAFSRRMDVVIHFRAPDEWRRYDIVRSHLLPGDRVDDEWLQNAACRCTLSGGQWRNVVAHARLLAIREDGVLRTAHLRDALTREYRKTGGVSPLRPEPVPRVGAAPLAVEA
jgi:hypothetical protein